MNCANHSDRTANHLCLGCGQWFCDSCFGHGPQKNLCRNCAARGVQVYSQQHSPGHAPLQRSQGQGSREFVELVRSLHRSPLRFLGSLGALGLSTALLAGLGTSVAPVFQFPAALGVLSFLALALSPVYLPRVKFAQPAQTPEGSRPRAGKAPRASGQITDEQINTVLKLSRNQMTIKRLSSATGVSEELVRKRLNELVLEGRLEVGSNDQELVYSRPELEG